MPHHYTALNSLFSFFTCPHLFSFFLNWQLFIQSLIKENISEIISRLIKGVYNQYIIFFPKSFSHTGLTNYNLREPGALVSTNLWISKLCKKCKTFFFTNLTIIASLAPPNDIQGQKEARGGPLQQLEESAR